MTRILAPAAMWSPRVHTTRTSAVTSDSMSIVVVPLVSVPSSVFNTALPVSTSIAGPSVAGHGIAYSGTYGHGHAAAMVSALLPSEPLPIASLSGVSLPPGMWKPARARQRQAREPDVGAPMHCDEHRGNHQWDLNGRNVAQIHRPRVRGLRDHARTLVAASRSCRAPSASSGNSGSFIRRPIEPSCRANRAARSSTVASSGSTLSIAARSFASTSVMRPAGSCATT